MDYNTLDQIQPFSGFHVTGGEQLNSALGAGSSLQQIKAPYVTAVSVPQNRSISRITSNVLQEAGLAGTNFYYRWTVKSRKTGEKTVIQGPSIDLAMCLIRNFGNCALDIEVEETASHYKFKGTVIDLESGFTCPRLFRQRKSQTMGNFDIDRQEDLLFQIGQSKAIRNAIIHYAPSWLIDKAIETAYNAELASIKPENMAIAQAKCINFFNSHGISVDLIENYIGRKADQWSQDDIVELRAVATGIKEGKINPKKLFALDDSSMDSQPQPDQKQEVTTESMPQDSQATNPWDRSVWINLKKPGLIDHVLAHHAVYGQTDPFIQKIFADKWERCKCGPFPFDEKGQFTGFGDSGDSIENDPSKQVDSGEIPQSESDDPAEVDIMLQFGSWFQINYPNIPLHDIRNFIGIMGAQENQPPEYYADRMMLDHQYSRQIIEKLNHWSDTRAQGGSYENDSDL